MKLTKRKCSICHEEIILEDSNEDYFLITDTKGRRKVYHSDCFIKKETTKKNKPKTIEECKALIKEYRNLVPLMNDNEEQIELDEALNTAKYAKQKRPCKNDLLYEFIFDMYGITYLPTHFYIRMAKIYKGEMDGLKSPISSEELLDMWQRQRNNLEKIAANNIKKGKEMSTYARINYDLSILLSKYDSYVEWKEKQKLYETEVKKKKQIKKELEEMSKLTPIQNKKEDKKGVDISSMLDEI